MKKYAFIAALALVACNQPAPTAEPEAEAAPQSLMEQAQAQSADMQPVFAWQQLTAYQTAHPETQPPCSSIRGAESRGVIPDDVAPDSIYGPHKGSLVYSVQCGPQLTTVRDNPSEHWLVVFAPGATDPVVVNCANAAGRDQCPRVIPRVAASTPASAPAQ